MVECHLAKVDVEGSNPFSRSERASFTVREGGFLHSGFGGSEAAFTALDAPCPAYRVTVGTALPSTDSMKSIVIVSAAPYRAT